MLTNSVFLIFNALTALAEPLQNDLPEKLRNYQNVTGISEHEILKIYENFIKG